MNKQNIIQVKNISTEDVIKEDWYSPDIQVSIVCTAYNHEPYIRDAIEGFLSQKTNFAFEVLIHDDASTDETPNIIMEYHRSFPSIIIPVLQKENQLSKGTKIFSTYLSPIIKGKYIALCEGDDYWIDSSKLQKQYEALERNLSCDICFHPANYVYPNGSIVTMNQYDEVERVFPVDAVILGGGGYMPTASLFYRKEIRTCVDEFIEKYGRFHVGDVILQFLAARRGGALYLPMVGSVYRVNSIESWSSRMKKDSDFASKVRQNTIVLNEKINEFTNYEYNNYFRKKISRILFGYVTNPYMGKDERTFFLQNYSIYLDKSSRIRYKMILILRYLKKFSKQTLLKYSR